MSKDPMTNPSPSSKVPTYAEDPAVQRPMDGAAITEIVQKSGKAQRPAPNIPQRREATTGRWREKP